MTNLPREVQPPSALEQRVVSTLVAAGLVRRRREWPAWVAAAAVATVIVLGFGVTMFRPKHTLVHGNTYAVLLYEDSTYRPALAGHNGERVAELSRWADSLDAVGEFAVNGGDLTELAGSPVALPAGATPAGAGATIGTDPIAGAIIGAIYAAIIEDSVPRTPPFRPPA